MRRVALAVLLLLVTATPVAATPESYLAYRVRLARGESSYRLDAGLSRLAEVRSFEYALNDQRSVRPHRQLVEVPCAWGEILGWSVRPQPDATRWVMAAWRRSPTHWTVLRGGWTRYGVGVTYRGGAWYMAVVFAQCPL